MRCAACVCAYQPRVIRYVDPTNELYADRKEEEQEEEVEVDEDVFSIGGVEDVVEEEEEMKSVVVSRKRAREEEEGEMSVGEDPAPKRAREEEEEKKEAPQWTNTMRVLVASVRKKLRVADDVEIRIPSTTDAFACARGVPACAHGSACGGRHVAE